MNILTTIQDDKYIPVRSGGLRYSLVRPPFSKKQDKIHYPIIEKKNQMDDIKTSEIQMANPTKPMTIKRPGSANYKSTFNRIRRPGTAGAINRKLKISYQMEETTENKKNEHLNYFKELKNNYIVNMTTATTSSHNTNNITNNNYSTTNNINNNKIANDNNNNNNNNNNNSNKINNETKSSEMVLLSKENIHKNDTSYNINKNILNNESITEKINKKNNIKETNNHKVLTYLDYLNKRPNTAVTISKRNTRLFKNYHYTDVQNNEKNKNYKNPIDSIPIYYDIYIKQLKKLNYSNSIKEDITKSLYSALRLLETNSNCSEEERKFLFNILAIHYCTSSLSSNIEFIKKNKISPYSSYLSNSKHFNIHLNGNKNNLDFYIIGKTIGTGSFGQVRTAIHKLTSQRVAIKTYERDKLINKNSNNNNNNNNNNNHDYLNEWKRFQQEIKIMEKLNHPYIIRMFESIETNKKIHIIMEHTNGGNLCNYVKNKIKLNENETRYIFQQIISAVGYMHHLNIIHRDIKLENILLDNYNNIKLIDFGFSAIVSTNIKNSNSNINTSQMPSNKVNHINSNSNHNNNKENQRLLSTFCGTPSYMAPEIIQRKLYYGEPIDIWSIGVLLYAMLCGHFPFIAKNYNDLYKKVIQCQLKIPEYLSLDVQDLLRNILVVDPTKRFTLSQIASHPWLNISISNDLNPWFTPNSIHSYVYVPPITCHLISKNPIEDIQMIIINKLEEFGLNKIDVINAITMGKYNGITCIYYLILLKAEIIRRSNYLSIDFKNNKQDINNI